MAAGLLRQLNPSANCFEPTQENTMSEDACAPAIETPIDHNYHQLPSDLEKRFEASRSPDYHAYRKKWVDNPTERIVEDFPIHLDVEATSSCNLKCGMCPRTEMLEEGRFWKVRPFDLATYKRLIDEGVERGLCSVKYNFLGEPLVNKRIVEMVEYAKNAGVVDVMFNTNATLLDEETSRRLIASGLDKLFFSFDSPHREKYESIRVGANFDDVLNNIKNFMRIRDELGSVTPFTRVSMVMMKETEDEWEDFKALFEPIVDAVAYVDYIEHTGQNNIERQIIPVGSRKSKFCCPQLWQRTFVHPDGVVSVCCIDAVRELTVGNINDNSLAEIWRGEEYTRLRDLHASGRIDEIPTCARCPLAQY